MTVEATIIVDDESVARCVAYVTRIRDLHATEGGLLFVEQKLSIEHITGEAGATGTSDVVIVAPPVLTIADLKSGSGRVAAFKTVNGKVVLNKQLSMYADAALVEYAWMGEFTHVRMMIVMPRIKYESEITVTVAELKEAVQALRESAEQTRTNPVFVPSSDNCHFCDARMSCEARQLDVLKTSLSDFDDMPQPVPLGVLYSKLGLILDWCADIKTKTIAALTAGTPVDGYKLVTGKKGDRAWSDPVLAEATMTKCLNDQQMYKRSLISPTVAATMVKVRKVRNSTEKPAPAPIGPVIWAELQTLIVQPDGKPEVAPESDGREAIVIDLFPDVAVPTNDADLFN